MLNALDIQVTGVVQGVGFRPFVYRLAKRYLLSGWVLNAVDGVHIHVEGDQQLVDEFVLDMHDNPPAAAHIKRIDMKEVPLEGFDSFEIRFSDEDAVEEPTLVSPDLATCDDCVGELFDPANRRYRYPFINCTNCGPRFTIIDELPYDRAKTSMRGFAMCDDCAREYADASDRRFHAQPDACFECGPRLCLVDPDRAGASGAAAGESAASAAQGPGALSLTQAEWAATREESDAFIARVVDMLAAGKIVAVKGLGGFHLVCDASNAEAVAKVRARKRREGKAFAVMLPDAEAVREWCFVGEEEQAMLRSPARPIVLLRKRPEAELTPGLADALPELGVMLPATPLQHMLLHDFALATGRRMLVFTSGNVHDDPIQIDDAQACVALSGIADALMGNDRPIRSRYDDSVVRILDFGEGESAVQVVRRARGFAPLPIVVASGETQGATGDEDPDAFAAVADDGCGAGDVMFATGPEQKNTFCFLQGSRAFVSQHIGDMEHVPAYDAWLEAKACYERLFDLSPAAVACDMHPEYLTSKWAADQALPVVRVQHHHAHIASAMAENGLEGPVLGLAFDGTGAGADGAVWGGEALLANRRTYERFANFAYFPLPGGAAAIRHPLRCAYGALWAFDLLDHPGAARVLEGLGDEASVCERMIDTGLNTPYTSSVGRLFDAASAILGLCSEPTYEGEGAVLLQAAIGSVGGCDRVADAPAESDALPADGGTGGAYVIDLVKNTATDTSTALDTSVVLLDAQPLFAALLDDVEAGVALPRIARRFHDAFVDAIVQLARLGEAAFGIGTVVLSGGVFQNRYLIEHAVRALAAEGYTVAMNRELPPNDGCISFGQAIVASQQAAG